MPVRQASLDSINRHVDYVASLHDNWPGNTTDEQMAFVFATLVPNLVSYLFLSLLILHDADPSLELSRQGLPPRPQSPRTSSAACFDRL